jgi:aminopeptidase-like protein
MTEALTQLELEAAGQAMYSLAAELFPLCRSVTGAGVRQTLARLQAVVPLAVREVPSGTKVFDWVVPREWNIKDAYIADESGRRVVDFRESNLHVVSGSVPVRQRMSWEELRPRLHTLPEYPSWVPYRTSFHSENWGFCLTHERFVELDRLGNRSYEVVIDSSLTEGSLTYGELLLPGEADDEVLVSTHICHPSLANDGLSGMVVAAWLARELARRERRYSYRFLFIPATIGAITWLSLNETHTARIKHGWVLSVVGDNGGFTYKRSRQGDAEIDRVFGHVLRHSCERHSILDFEPFGYDQRQFCSPGFDLPMGCLMRTPNECYEEYHTSADNLDLIQPQRLAGSLEVCLTACEVLDGNRTYRNLNPKCEPRLGPRGLYHAFGSRPDRELLQKSLLWALNLSDGQHTLLDIAERSGVAFGLVRQAADLLLEHDLLELLPKSTPENCERPELLNKSLWRNVHEYRVLQRPS